MQTLLIWKVQPQNHQKALQEFLRKGATDIPGTKVTSNVHGAGVGAMVIESDDINPVMAFYAAWAPYLEIEAHPVVSEADALAGLKALAGKK